MQAARALELAAVYGRLRDGGLGAQAAQALEPAAVLAVGAVSAEGQVVLVGDPQQLPPTVLSRSAAARHLSQSLFERLQRVPSFLAICPLLPCHTLLASIKLSDF